MATRILNDGYYVDGITGEVVPVAANATIMTQEEREARKGQVQQIKTAKETVVAQKELCGDFYWTLFDTKEKYYPDISDDLLAKIVYLITFMDYETNLLVVRDSITEPKRPMLKKDVAKVIRLYRTKFQKFWNSLMATGVITEQPDGSLRVCDKFCKGSLTDKNATAMKVFTHAVRYIYENTDLRSQRYISYLFRLIPYINLRYNIVCKNPLETERSEVVRMTGKEVCRMFGVDDSNVRRFLRMLLHKINFVDKNGDTRSVVRYIVDGKNNVERAFITINPQFYAGYISKTDMLNILDEFTIKDDGESFAALE